MELDKKFQQAQLLLKFGKRMRENVMNAFVQANIAGQDGAGYDLSPPQMHMLMQINKIGEATISEIAEILKVSTPSASAMVDRLAEKKILLRERSTTDRRVVTVRLSKQAADHIEIIEEAMIRAFIAIIEKVGPELTEQWCDVVTRIETILAEEEQ